MKIHIPPTPFGKKKGQSLIEFALVLIVLLMLLSAAADFGSAFLVFIALRDASEEGALYGSINPIIDANNNKMYDVGETLNTTAVIDHIRRSTSGPVDLTNIATTTVTVTFSSPPCAGGWIQVDIYHNYQIISPLLSGTTIPLHARVVNTILIPGCH